MVNFPKGGRKKNEGTTEKNNCRAFSILLLFPFEEDWDRLSPLF